MILLYGYHPTSPFVGTDFFQEVRDSKEIKDLLNRFKSDPSSMIDYSVHDELLYWKNRIYIHPSLFACIEKLLELYHSSPLGEHAGLYRTLACIATHFYWPAMRKDVAEYIKKCQVCQRAKSLQTHPNGLLSPLPIPAQVWEDIAMDFITGLPVHKGFSVIMVVVDRLSKYGHFIPLHASYTSQPASC